VRPLIDVGGPSLERHLEPLQQLTPVGRR
jgi:hypothetical protein